ncbi:serine/arginine repetitive matrix protein 1-like [Meles meles]|uniref:serine/arginine repetitive matrix protein 1-like n=1 Tax=Meles meles TaxID=9662 RepID=UPI001E699265|nr:serine/arginine repetitive matrix protein 1-like [Meles meles]
MRLLPRVLEAARPGPRRDRENQSFRKVGAFQPQQPVHWPSQTRQEELTREAPVTQVTWRLGKRRLAPGQPRKRSRSPQVRPGALQFNLLADTSGPALPGPGCVSQAILGNRPLMEIAARSTRPSHAEGEEGWGSPAATPPASDELGAFAPRQTARTSELSPRFWHPFPRRAELNSGSEESAHETHAPPPRWLRSHPTARSGDLVRAYLLPGPAGPRRLPASAAPPRAEGSSGSLGRSDRGGVCEREFCGATCCCFFFFKEMRRTRQTRKKKKNFFDTRLKQRPRLVQSSCSGSSAKKQKQNSPSANLEPARRQPSLPNTREFSVCRSDPKERRYHSPWCPNRLREPEAPPRPRREKARGRLRLPAPLLRGKATPQLCARAARSSCSSSAAAPRPPHPGPPPQACLFVGERSRRPKREGARERAGAPCRPSGKRTGARAPRGSLSPGGGGRAGPLPRPAPPPALPLPLGSRPRPRRRRSGNFVPGERPLSAPVRPRPRRPLRAGLLERGAPGHLTARPVNQRPPCAPSPPAAARRALGWPGAARPARLPVRAARGEREWAPRTNTRRLFSLHENGSHAPTPGNPRSSSDFALFEQTV